MPSLLDGSAPFADVSDHVAVEEVLRGNREMFEVLVRRHNQRLYRIGLACLQDPHRAEDAMQNTYLKAFLHLSRFRREASFATWLTRIMINECRMLRRSRAIRREAPWDDPRGDRVPDAAAAPAGQALTLNEMKTALEEAISTLPAKYRRVYMLREVQQLNTSETAACLGLSAGSVKVTLHRARELLKTRLLKAAAASELFPYRALRCDPMTARVMASVLAISPA